MEAQALTSMRSGRGTSLGMLSARARKRPGYRLVGAASVAALLAGLLCLAPAPPIASPVAAAAPRPTAVASIPVGTTVGWGDSDFGQTVVPPGLTNVTQVAAGLDFSLALKSDGTIVAWGGNLLGQTTVPALPPAVTYTAIAAGDQFAVALRSNGTVVAWGASDHGQLTVPALPPAVTYTAVSASAGHALALRSDGTVAAWGANASGESTVPGGLSGVTAVAAGGLHSLALESDGTIVAWGSNTMGQTTVPALPSGRTYVKIAAGQRTSLAVRDDGVVVVWGDTSQNEETVPAGVASPLAIAGGDLFCVAVKSDGTVAAWGSDALGQITVPAGLSNVTAIAAGWYHVLARRSDGTVVAWGEVHSAPTQAAIKAIGIGQGVSLAVKANGTVVAWGQGIFGDTAVPHTLTGVTAVAAGSTHSLALKSDGTVVGWGNDASGQVSGASAVTGVTAISANQNFSLALKSTGTVVGWGDNASGQITIPGGLTHVVAIAAGGSHSLALKSDGTVVGWGNNTASQSSGGTGLTGIVAIAAGLDFSLALKSDGTVHGWGNNSKGQITVPPSLSHVVSIAAGDAFGLALKDDGTVVAWGENDFGELHVPAGLHGVTAIAAQGPHALALQYEYPASTFHSIAPGRVLDTRTGTGFHNIGLQGPFVAGTVRTFAVAGVFPIGATVPAVPTYAVAVTGNLTITNETAGGVMALGPAMTSIGSVTTLNFAMGDTRANNVTIGLAPDGTLSAVMRSPTAGAATQLVFDVTGYFTADTNGATYHAVPPGRILDTRPTITGRIHMGVGGKLTTRVVRTISVAGVKAIGWPSALVPSNATGITANLTVANATSNGYVSLGPTMTSAPTTSTINIVKGVNLANGVTVALKSGKCQAVWVAASGGTIDLIMDVNGYFTNDASGVSYHAIVPVRFLDTVRPLGLSGVFVSGTPRSMPLAGSGEIAVGSAGVSANLTAINPSSAGWAQAAPVITSTPTSSTVNALIHQTVANGLDVRLSSGNLAFFWGGTPGSTTNLSLDVTGYWK